MAADWSGRVVEVRIHGVGGSPGARLLGLESDEDAIVVGEGAGARFLARRSDPTDRRDLEGYDWGGLTSDAATQPLWVLLLPFTLMNVAGWTHPTMSVGRARVVRGLVHACAVALTAMWTCWLAIVIADQMGYQWLGRLKNIPGPAAAAGIVVTWLVMVGIGRIAGRTISTFEARPVAEVPVLPARWASDETLKDQTFFAHATSTVRLLSVHRWVIRFTIAALGVRALYAAANDQPMLRLGDVYRPIATFQGFVLAGLLAVGAWGWLRNSGHGGRGVSRLLAELRPFATAALAIALTTGVFSGLVLVTRDRLNRGDGTGPRVDTGGELALVDGSFLVLVVWVLILVSLVGWSMLRGRGADLPPRKAGPARELDGAEQAMCKRVGRTVRLAKLSHAMADVLTALALVGMLMSFCVVVLRFGIPEWIPLLGRPPAWALDPGGRLAGAAAWAFPLLTLFLIGIVQRAARDSKLRRTVGILWDVLSFWPRRFHPFAVRPYSERAVPEFQARLLMHLENGHRLVVSAHSQGSIIATAALAPLSGDERLERVAYITYGCPLLTLYESSFGAYFKRSLSVETRAALAADPAGGHLWTNLWRRTDPIGGPVFSPDGRQPGDVEVGDPAMGPPSWADAHVPGDEEPLRTTWTEIGAHSHFHRELAYKSQLARLRVALGGPPRA